MPRLSPQLNNRGTKRLPAANLSWLGTGAQPELNTAGVSSTMPTDPGAGSGEDITPPLSSNAPSKYPSYKRPSWIANAMSGGMLGRQTAQMNQQGMMAQAAEQAKLTEEEAKNQAALKLENQTATNKVLGSSQLTPDYKSKYDAVVNDPEFQDLLSNHVKNKLREEEFANKLKEAEAARAGGEGNRATEEAKMINAKLPLVPTEQQANIDATKATTRSKTAESVQQEGLNTAGILPLGSQFLAPTKPNPGLSINRVQSAIPGYNDVLNHREVPTVPGGVFTQPLGSSIAAPPAGMIGGSSTNNATKTPFTQPTLPNGVPTDPAYNYFIDNAGRITRSPK